MDKKADVIIVPNTTVGFISFLSICIIFHIFKYKALLLINFSILLSSKNIFNRMFPHFISFVIFDVTNITSEC